MKKKEISWRLTLTLLLAIFCVGLAFSEPTISDTGSTFDAEMRMENADFYLEGSSSNIKSDSEIDMYPSGSTTKSFRFVDEGGELKISANGYTSILFDDSFKLEAGKSFYTVGDTTFYYGNQTSEAFRFTNSGGIPTIQALGSTEIGIDDQVVFNQQVEIGEDTPLRLYSNVTDVIGDPQAIELYGLEPESKAYLAWRTWFDNGVEMEYNWSAWLGAHYNTSINGDAHQHWSVETLDTDTGVINTRFEILLGKPVEDLFVGFNAVNYVNLKTGVDLRFTESGVERARIEVDEVTKNFNVTVPDDKHISLHTGGSGEVRIFGGNLALENGKNIVSDERIDFYPNDQYTRSFSVEDDGSDSIIKVYGDDTLIIDENEVKVTGVSSDGTGSVVCIKSNGAFGTCTDAPDASGDCTCT